MRPGERRVLEEMHAYQKRQGADIAELCDLLKAAVHKLGEIYDKQAESDYRLGEYLKQQARERPSLKRLEEAVAELQRERQPNGAE